MSLILLSRMYPCPGSCLYITNAVLRTYAPIVFVWVGSNSYAVSRCSGIRVVILINIIIITLSFHILATAFFIITFLPPMHFSN